MLIRFSSDSRTKGWQQASAASHEAVFEANAVTPLQPTHSVLIVEDDPDISMALQDLLQFQGIRVDCVSTCRQAFSLLEQYPYNAVLLDIGLPDGDGRSVLAKLRVSNPSLPVIVLTASNTDLGSLQPYARLTKPCQREELFRILHRAIGTAPSSTAK